MIETAKSPATPGAAEEPASNSFVFRQLHARRVSLKTAHESVRGQPRDIYDSAQTHRHKAGAHTYQVRKFNRFGFGSPGFLAVDLSVSSGGQLFFEREGRDALHFRLADLSTELCARPDRLRFIIRAYKAFIVAFKSQEERNEVHMLLLRRASRTQKINVIQIKVATWNMGSALPDPSTLRHWLQPGAQLYAIGLQEGARATSDGDKASTEVLNAMQQALGPTFLRVAVCCMGQIYLLVLADNEIHPLIAGVETAAVPTGVAGVGKNKGAVAVSFTLHQKTVRRLSTVFP